MEHSRLSRIDTVWSMVRKAHDSQDSGNHAQAMLIDRYGPAIKRYLLASMRDEEAANDVFQEFALRLARGDFRNAESSKGKFRHLIKASLYRLMVDYHRRNQKLKKLGSGNEMLTEPAADTNESDDSFSLEWRQSLLDESWNRLEQLEQQTGKPYFTSLKWRVDNPGWTTNQLHQALSEAGYAIPAISAFRVFLHRARKRFAAILLRQVTESLQDPTDEEVEQELIELGLHHYCKNV